MFKKICGKKNNLNIKNKNIDINIICISDKDKCYKHIGYFTENNKEKKIIIEHCAKVENVKISVNDKKEKIISVKKNNDYVFEIKTEDYDFILTPIPETKDFSALRKDICFSVLVPSECNLKCSYCYRGNDYNSVLFESNLEKQEEGLQKYYQIENFDRLVSYAKIQGKEKFIFWISADGETLLSKILLPLIPKLTQKYKVAIVSNLSCTKELDYLLEKSNCNNLAIYWSIHWIELNRLNLLNTVILNVEKLINKSVKIWPNIVMIPEYFQDFDKILGLIKSLNLKLIPVPCKNINDHHKFSYVSDSGKLLTQKYYQDPNIDLRTWNLTLASSNNPYMGQCSVGRDFVFIQNEKIIRGCPILNNNSRTIPLDEKDKFIFLDVKNNCPVDFCYKTRGLLFGSNSNVQCTYNDSLDGWSDFLNA